MTRYSVEVELLDRSSQVEQVETFEVDAHGDPLTIIAPIVASRYGDRRVGRLRWREVQW